MNERLGEINKNKFGTKMKIIAYRKSDDIDVQFLDKDGYIFKHQIDANFKSGGIKNPYDRNICGVGYMGVGKYHCKYSNGIHTMEYQNWIAMIRRCYDERRKRHIRLIMELVKYVLNGTTFKYLEHGMNKTFTKLEMKGCILIKIYYILEIKFIVQIHVF